MYISLLGKTPNGDTSLTVFLVGIFFWRQGCIKTFSDAFCLYGAVFLIALLEASILFENFSNYFLRTFLLRRWRGRTLRLWIDFPFLFLIWKRKDLRSWSLHDLSSRSRMMCKAVPSLFFDLEGSWGYS